MFRPRDRIVACRIAQLQDDDEAKRKKEEKKNKEDKDDDDMFEPPVVTKKKKQPSKKRATSTTAAAAASSRKKAKPLQQVKNKKKENFLLRLKELLPHHGREDAFQLVQQLRAVRAKHQAGEDFVDQMFATRKKGGTGKDKEAKEKQTLLAARLCVSSLSLAFYELIDGRFRTNASIQGLQIPKDESVVAFINSRVKFSERYVAMTRVRFPEQYVCIGHSIPHFLALRPEPYQLERLRQMELRSANAPRALQALEEEMFGEPSDDTKEWLTECNERIRIQVQMDEEKRQEMTEQRERSKEARKKKKGPKFNAEVQDMLAAAASAGMIEDPDQFDYYNKVNIFSPSTLAQREETNTMTIAFCLNFGGLSSLFKDLWALTNKDNRRLIVMLKQQINLNQKLTKPDKYILLKGCIVYALEAWSLLLNPDARQVVQSASDLVSKQKTSAGKTFRQEMNQMLPRKFPRRVNNPKELDQCWVISVDDPKIDENDPEL